MADDEWIWGRYRGGGGGAPLRDVDGNLVSNLRLVHHGAVQVDNSPSPSSKGNNNPHRKPRGFDYDDKYSRRDRDDHDYDRPVRGLEGHYENRAPQRNINMNNRNNHNDNNGSPRKFMGALRELIDSTDPDERVARLNKEKQYQALLQEQIDEKKRIKEQEEIRKEAEKRRELEEYLSVHYNGKIPPNAMPAPSKYKRREDKGRRADKESVAAYKHVVSPRRNRSDNDNNSRSLINDNGPSIDRLNLDDLDNRDGNWTPPRRGVSDGRGNNNYDDIRGRGRGRRDEDYDNYDTRNSDVDRDRDRGGRRNNKALMNDNARNRGNNDSYDDYNDSYDAPPSNTTKRGQPGYVSQIEYDELSNLCERLMDQQEALHQEMREQASLIQDLKDGGGSDRGDVSTTKRRTGVTNRSRSTTNTSNNNEKPKWGRGPGLAKSKAELYKQDADNTRKAASRVSGQPQRFPKPKPMQRTRSAYKVREEETGSSQSQCSRVRSAGTRRGNSNENVNTGNGNGNARGNVIRPIRPGPRVRWSDDDLHRNDRPDPIPIRNKGESHLTLDVKGKSGGGGGDGFGALRERAGAGPLVVTHEDGDGYGVAGYRAGNFPPRGSPNRRNASPIRGRGGGDPDDVVSEDQLDRLLMKASKARAV